MLNIYGTGKGAVEQFKLYHLCKKFIVEVVDKVLMYFLPLKKEKKNLFKHSFWLHRTEKSQTLTAVHIHN